MHSKNGNDHSLLLSGLVEGSYWNRSTRSPLRRIVILSHASRTEFAVCKGVRPDRAGRPPAAARTKRWFPVLDRNFRRAHRREANRRLVEWLEPTGTTQAWPAPAETRAARHFLSCKPSG